MSRTRHLRDGGSWRGWLAWYRHAWRREYVQDKHEERTRQVYRLAEREARMDCMDCMDFDAHPTSPDASPDWFASNRVESRLIRQRALRDIFALRAQEKFASRAADAEALASGAKSREQLRAENGSFAFPSHRVRIDFSKVKTKD